jgi:hypothetical protein
VDPRIERVASTLGDAEELMPVIGGRLTLPGADRIGIREIRAVSDDTELDGTPLGRTAVNLFSADESDVTPGDPLGLADMGRPTAGAGASSQPTRAEWWWPLALVALALLTLEWLLFHRPTRQRLARALGRRPLPLGGRAR